MTVADLDYLFDFFISLHPNKLKNLVKKDVMYYGLHIHPTKNSSSIRKTDENQFRMETMTNDFLSRYVNVFL